MYDVIFVAPFINRESCCNEMARVKKRLLFLMRNNKIRIQVELQRKNDRTTFVSCDTQIEIFLERETTAQSPDTMLFWR